MGSEMCIRDRMDVLVMGSYLLMKPEQPAWPEAKGGANDDVDLPESPVRSRLRSKLEKFFDAQIAPLQVQNGVGKFGIARSSTWEPIDHVAVASDFVIPNALDQANFDPAAMARAITRFWRPARRSARLELILESLLELARRHPADGPLEERVSAMAYVMF